MVWGGGLRVLGIEGCRALRLRVVEKSHLGVQGSGRGSGLLSVFGEIPSWGLFEALGFRVARMLL